jgi:hypothetical protein
VHVGAREDRPTNHTFCQATEGTTCFVSEQYTHIIKQKLLIFLGTNCGLRCVAQLSVVESPLLRLDIPRAGSRCSGCQLCLPSHDYVGQYRLFELVICVTSVCVCVCVFVCVCIHDLILKRSG